MSGFLVKSFDTNIALYFTTNLSGWYFFLKSTYNQWLMLLYGGLDGVI